jgi:purine-nucleoside phosphorylase
MQTGQELNNKINAIHQFILTKLPNQINLELGIILGSGLGQLVDGVEQKIVIPYQEIPHLPISTAPGHAGNLVIGKLSGKWVMVMQGRLHVYEGYSPIDATLLIRVMKLLGIGKLVITCAAGGLNTNFKAGQIMLISDHINFSGANPLLGENLSNFGPRFPVMFDVYTPRLITLAQQVALQLNFHLNVGVYAAILGPAYATRAELQFLINNHCDAIGMSVVHEAMIAAHSEMEVLGLAAITDMALPYSGHGHSSGDEVVSSAKRIQAQFKQLLLAVIASCN